MKIAIVTMVKNEDLYLKEWIEWYRNLGVKDFFIFDNDSTTPVSELLGEQEGVRVIPYHISDEKSWEVHQNIAFQMGLQLVKDFDWVGFLDTDEYIDGVDNLANGISDCVNRAGVSDAVTRICLFWRMYYSSPAFETMQPVKSYEKWKPHGHFKNFVKPEYAIRILNQHRVETTGYSINELGEVLADNVSFLPDSYHTSQHLWIKHIWTRSLEEWKVKVEKSKTGTNVRTMEQFYEYNKD